VRDVVVLKDEAGVHGRNRGLDSRPHHGVQFGTQEAGRFDAGHWNSSTCIVAEVGQAVGRAVEGVDEEVFENDSRSFHAE
jgi:hypothetical protein